MNLELNRGNSYQNNQVNTYAGIHYLNPYLQILFKSSLSKFYKTIIYQDKSLDDYKKNLNEKTENI